MHFDILPTLEPGLYPWESPHQRDIEHHFGTAVFRELSTEEIEQLAELEIFFVMFTNRCGSTYLTEMMHQVGFGIPPKAEVFNSDLLIASCEHDGVKSFTHYFMRAVLGWQARGQVGFKIGAHQLFWLTRTGLLSHFKKVQLINSMRRDKVDQAVSLYIATHTGQWHSLMEKQRDTATLAYSRTEILQCLKSIHEGQALIKYYADIHNLPALEVYYENTLEDAGREIKRIAEFLSALHLENVPIDPTAISIQKQANQDNMRMCQRFRQEFSYQFAENL